ncbi:MAG: DUF2330 domain-containing protein [Myxococcales bacterium]|nr:DUF2330 domain-containing protein [Myxococcales bacterium]
MRRSVVLASLAAVAAAVSVTDAAQAFCGFYVAPSDQPLYNDATMVALMREGTRMVISMSNNYKGPAADFAMVVPVPVVLQKENVRTLPLDLFKKLESLSAPRLVEYWEQDPCYQPPQYAPEMASGAPMAAPPTSMKEDAAPKDYGVKIEAQFKVGEYEVVVLSAKESDGLESYLLDNKYKIPKGASTALAPYVREQWKFFVAKVDMKKVQTDQQGVATLSPLRFHYESQDFRLPVRLGLLNANGKQDLLMYVIGKNKRYEAANYPNAFIPTNLEVNDGTRKAFGPFYAALFDATMVKAGGRAVVTEYAWETSSCDPCPSPPLEQSDVVTLGGDVLFKKLDDGQSYGYGEAQGMVLTRLHTRYDPSTLTDDIVFKVAEPVVGGREHVVSNGKLEEGAKPDSSNNFQARYAIRHPWKGPIQCSNPKRGIWGGPPSGVSPPEGGSGPLPATNLAGAPRGTVKISDHVVAGLEDPESWDRAAVQAQQAGFGLGPRRACGCSVPGTPMGWGAGVGAGTAFLGLLVARRRTRRPR